MMMPLNLVTGKRGFDIVDSADKAIRSGRGLKPVQLRRDAQERRERLIAAAVELFATEGFDVPLEKVADRAQIGRATLYRNFPDRESLGVAVLHVRLDQFQAQVSQWSDRSDAFFLGVLSLANVSVMSRGFEKITTVGRAAPSIASEFRKGLKEIMAEPLERAKAAGLIRQDFDIDDLPLIMLMVAAGGFDQNAKDKTGHYTRALNMLKRGLSPTPKDV